MENAAWHALLAEAENRVDLGLPASDPQVVIQTIHALIRVVEAQLPRESRPNAYDRTLAYLALAATRDGANKYADEFDFLIAQTMGLQAVSLQQSDPSKALQLFRLIVEHGQVSNEANVRRTSATAGFFAGVLGTHLSDFSGAISDYRASCNFTVDVIDDLAYSRKVFTASQLNIGFIELEMHDSPAAAGEVFESVLSSFRGYARDMAILGLDTHSAEVHAASESAPDSPPDEEAGQPVKVNYPAFSHVFTVKMPSVESMLEIAESNRRVAKARAENNVEVDTIRPMTDADRADLQRKLQSADQAINAQQPHAALAQVQSSFNLVPANAEDEALLAEAYGLAHAALRAAEEHESSLETARALIDRFSNTGEQKAVARAVFRMALTLDSLNRPGDELKAYRALVTRWSDSDDPEVRFWVARALHYSGLTVKRTGDHLAALNYFERSVEYVGDQSSPELDLVSAEVLRDIAATYRESEQTELEFDAIERLRSLCGESKVLWVQEIVNAESRRHNLEPVGVNGPIIERPHVDHIEDVTVGRPRSSAPSGNARHATPIKAAQQPIARIQEVRIAPEPAAVSTVSETNDQALKSHSGRARRAATTRRPWWKVW